MDTGIKMIGMEKLIHEMDKLPKKIRRKGLRKATTAGAKVLVKAIKLILGGKTGVSRPGEPPGMHTGNLMKSTAYKILRSRAPNEMVALIGHETKSSGKAAKKLGAHAHLLEKGTEKMAARPYFKPTFKRKINAMNDAMVKVLTEILYGS